MQELLKKLLAYNFNEINYEFEGLTPKEKAIFGTKETFDKFLLHYMVKK